MTNAWRRAKAEWDRISPRTHDVVFMILSTVISIAIGFDNEGSVFGGFTAAAIGVVATTALWWRRTHPIAVILIGLVVMLLAYVPSIVAIGLFSLAIRRRDRVLAWMAVLCFTVLALSPINNISLKFSDLAGSAFATSQIVLIGAYIGARRDLITSLRDRITRAEAEREIRAEQARIGERSRIAREMHDVLAHKVSLIALHAGALEVNPGVPPERVAESASLIRTTARQALEDLRGVLGVLRSDTTTDGSDLAPQPTLEDLNRLVQSSREAGIPVELNLQVDELPEPLGRTVYRVVQESLTNVHKHARGAATSIVVYGDKAVGLTVEVTNLRPVASDTLLPGSGAGLVGLRERVELLGGRLQSGPNDSGGWDVTAWLPWTTSPTTVVSGSVATEVARSDASSSDASSSDAL